LSVPPPKPAKGRAAARSKVVVPAARPGERREFRLQLLNLDRFSRVAMPGVVLRGRHDGPTLAVTAAIHGDELNGIEIARRLTNDIDPTYLSGRIIALPSVNVMGVLAGSRYMPDGRDLNREFPGSTKGSFTARVARRVLRVLDGADGHIDLHTGTRGRANMPHVRAHLDDARVAALARAFGAPVIFDQRGSQGTLRRTLVDRGVPSILFEAGQASVFQPYAIRAGIQGAMNVMRHLGMLRGEPRRPPVQLELEDAHWVRTSTTGLLEVFVKPGDILSRGDLIARNVSIFGDHREEITADRREVVLGLATHPLAAPGTPVAHLLEFRALPAAARKALARRRQLDG